MKHHAAIILALLSVSTPSNAALYDYSFDGWISQTERVRGNGTVETPNFGLGIPDIGLGIPVFLRAGGVTLQNYYSNFGPQAIPYCNVNPTNCHTLGGTGISLIVTSLQWVNGYSGGNIELMFSFAGAWPSAIVTNPWMPLTLTANTTIAAPGPIAGASLPALALFFWSFRRRRRTL